MQKAIFLDRDGTINVEKNYLYKIEDFEYLPGVIEALKLLSDAGYLLVIVTNQSGIARGYYTESDFQKLNDWMLKDLLNQDIQISRVYYCPHHPDSQIEEYRLDCECRKPKLGMYEQAIKDLDIDIENSYAIGDKIRDCEICQKSGCKGFLIADSEKSDIIKAVQNKEYNNIEYRKDLLDCARIIAGMED